jgi:hypothetical protein
MQINGFGMLPLQVLPLEINQRNERLFPLQVGATIHIMDTLESLLISMEMISLSRI